MTLIRWEPVRELDSLQNEMNRLFSSFFDAPSGAGAPVHGRRWIPAMDLVEEGEHFVLRADLPGLGEDDVKIEVEDRVLTLSGERRSEHAEDKGARHRVERATGSFTRSLTLPQGVEADAIAARFDRGVLEIRIPKPEEKKPRRVAIAVGDQPRTIESEGAAQPDRELAGAAA